MNASHWEKMKKSQQQDVLNILRELQKALAADTADVPANDPDPSYSMLRPEVHRAISIPDEDEGVDVFSFVLEMLRMRPGFDCPDADKLAAPLRGNVIVLEPLDLRTAPADTNIIVAVLSRLTKQNPVTAIMMAERNAALAIPGNLAQRAGNMDPHQFAIEVMESERYRLDFPKTLRAGLAAVTDRKKLFVCLVRITAETKQAAMAALELLWQPGLAFLLLLGPDVEAL